MSCLLLADELSVFQSTLPQGERLAFVIGSSPVKIFQSTLPQGERL